MTAQRQLRVVMFVQKVDEADWLVGFTVAWLRALAARVETLDVITLENRTGSDSLPTNVTVRSLGKERHVGRVAELIAFERIVGDLARRVDILFGHLTPRYTWLAAPWAARYRVPQCLWYTHRQIDRELQLALRSVRWVVTAAPNSFPLPGPKVHVLGHGIDTDYYTPSPAVALARPPLILAVGRLAAIKRHDILLEAAAVLRDRGIAAQYIVAGGAVGAEGTQVQDALTHRIAALGLTDRFMLAGPLNRDALLQCYRQATIVTNLSPPGLFDKAALEAMSTARPVLVSNPAFDPLLGDYQPQLRIVDPPEAVTVADHLSALLQQSPAERQIMGAALRERTQQAHGLDRLMDRLVALWSEPNRAKI